jgi:hypothetical protein
MDKPTEKLIDLLKSEQDANSKIRRYFSYSQLFKAIVDHIYKNKDTPIINREQDPVVCYSYGIAISFEGAHLYAGDSSVYSLRIEVTYSGPESDENGYTKSYYINVPTALEENFSQTGFKKWLAEKKEIRDAEREKLDMALMRTLSKRYPATFKKIAREL